MDTIIPILFINSVPKIGGAESSLIELASNLNRDKFSPYLLTEADSALAQKVRSFDIPVDITSFPFFSRRRPWVYIFAVRKIFSVIKRLGIAVVHVNCDKAVPHAVIASHFAQVPVICHIHDMTRAWFLPQYVKYLNHASYIIADSEATKRRCIEAGMVLNKLHVIYECIELKKYTTTLPTCRSNLRRQWGLSPETLAIGLVGQVLKQKGHEDFIYAAQILLQNYRQALFLVIGDDSLSSDREFFQYIQKLSVDLGISSSILFTGYLTDIPGVMSALDIVVVPSWEEPFGRVVIEAQAAKRPVVATNSGGIPEIIEHEKTGMLVPSKDPQELANALLQLCLNTDLRRKLGEAGPSSAQRFDVVEHTLQFETLYKSLLE